MKQNKYNWEEDKNIEKIYKELEPIVDPDARDKDGFVWNKLKELISNERKRIIDSLPEEKEYPMYDSFDSGYNKAIQEIKSKLEGK